MSDDTINNVTENNTTNDAAENTTDTAADNAGDTATDTAANDAADDSAPRVPKRHYRLRIYKVDESPFDDILRAVYDGVPKMIPGNKYTLRQIVELSNPRLWNRMEYYTRRYMGASFATEYYKLNIDTVKMVDPDQSPIRYLSV